MQQKLEKFWVEFRPKSFYYFQQGYTKEIIAKDLAAGITVAIVALPLAMAFAIASGVTPERGIFTAIVAGLIISFFGGSRVQIGGPTGAFVVIVYDIVLRHGYEGLVVTTLMAAFILIAMGFFRFGALIKYIPHPVIIGFTAGIALIIFSSQIKDFLGLHIDNMPADFIKQLVALFGHIRQTNPFSVLIALSSIGIILGLKKYYPKIPGPIAAVVFGALVVWFFNIPVETIESKFGQIPNMLPSPNLPLLSFDTFQRLLPDAFTIALLAAIESLLCAVVADGMIGGRHKPNTELIAQGLANIGSAIFGGIPATGAIARTVTSIKSGARTPLAGMIHAVVLFIFMLALSPLIVKIPLATLAAILIIVAWNMSEIKHIRTLFKAPKEDVSLLVITFLLTVLVNLTAAVQVGVILALFLFVKKLSESVSITDRKHQKQLMQEAETGIMEFEEFEDEDDTEKKKIPENVELYEFSGPLFFGVADMLKTILSGISKPPKVFILRMRNVPFIDATGMQALVDFHKKCEKSKTQLILSGVGYELEKDLQKFGFTTELGRKNICSHIDSAIKRAEESLKESKGHL